MLGAPMREELQQVLLEDMRAQLAPVQRVPELALTMQAAQVQVPEGPRNSPLGLPKMSC